MRNANEYLNGFGNKVNTRPLGLPPVLSRNGIVSKGIEEHGRKLRLRCLIESIDVILLLLTKKIPFSFKCFQDHPGGVLTTDEYARLLRQLPHRPTKAWESNFIKYQEVQFGCNQGECRG